MARKAKQSSPPASRRASTPPKASLSLKLLASVIAISPFLFDHSAVELLYPLFSAAPTNSLETAVPFYSTLLVIFLAQRALLKRSWSWRTQWVMLGTWKIASEGLIRVTGGKLLELGLTRGVIVGRLLLEGVPLLALANWSRNQYRCREVSQSCDNSSDTS
jgi:hypothetical protein